jgi:hypothetical protein
MGEARFGGRLLHGGTGFAAPIGSRYHREEGRWVRSPSVAGARARSRTSLATFAANE